MANIEAGGIKYIDNSRRRNSNYLLGPGEPQLQTWKEASASPRGHRRSSIAREPQLQTWNEASGTTRGRRRSSIVDVARHISNKLIPFRYAKVIGNLKHFLALL